MYVAGRLAVTQGARRFKGLTTSMALMFSLSLVLLTIATAGGHELHEADNATTSRTTTEDIGRHSTSKGFISDDARALFGINGTALGNGQLICPPTNLSGNYKTKTVTISLVGCYIDPFISLYTPQQRSVLTEHHDEQANCSAQVGIAGYLPPLAGTAVQLSIPVLYF